MKVKLQSDSPVTDESCKASTGKTFGEWFAVIEEFGPAQGRREVVQHLYNLMGRGKDTWWATTVWVEYERSKGIVNKKDGLAEGYNICSTKTIAASVDDVYEAWTQEGKNAWLGCNVAAEGADYSDAGGNQGKWVRLRPGKDVRLNWQTAGVETPTNIDAVFSDKGKGKTGIIVNHNRIQTRAEADGLRAAWAEAMDRLKAQLEA